LVLIRQYPSLMRQVGRGFERAVYAAVAILEWMDADEVEMCARVSADSALLPPRTLCQNQTAFHLRGHARRWRGPKMDRALVTGAGDHLHGIGVGAVAINLMSLSPAGSILRHSNIVWSDNGSA
jgi:hypothetical protein